MKKYALIPIDNRPVCYTLPMQISDIDNDTELFLPERQFLGDLTKNADTKAILNWMESLPNGLDAIIISLDTIAYGGLIPSRRSNDTTEDIKKRLDALKNIIKTKNTKIYAFSSIMRISNNNINEEEKEYWSEYGKKIFQYSYECHQKGLVTTDIPPQILQDYLNTRQRNFEINKLYLDWAKEGIIDTLVYSKDDCAEFGFNVMEAQQLQKLIKENNVNALVKTGADEIPLSLLSRAITSGKNLKIAPVFTQKDYTNKISKYEDISVFESVKGQIELAGCECCDETQADIILLVNNFKNEQGELVMGVDVEGFSGQLNLPQKPYLIADILNANGADNNFVKKFLEKDIDFTTFLGYAGWNTTGNTLGNAICCALMKHFSTNLNLSSFKKLQLIRFSDDWAYQANIRNTLKKENAGTNINLVSEKMKPYEQILIKKFNAKFHEIGYNFPWQRLFEIEVSIS